MLISIYRETFKLSEKDKLKKFCEEELISLYMDNRNKIEIHPL